MYLRSSLGESPVLLELLIFFLKKKKKLETWGFLNVKSPNFSNLGSVKKITYKLIYISADPLKEMEELARVGSQ